jgi:plasmid stabilization system protein ParE
MSALFQLTPQATEDLDGIWWFIEEGSREAANQVESEIMPHAAGSPGIPS